MSAKLKWITPEAENEIVNDARVSTPANRDNTSTGPRLIRYLVDHAHWSPFEMANLCIEIKTSRAVSAQIIRHRSFCFQEFSQRYSAVKCPDVVPPQRRQDSKNRQSSHDDLDPELKLKYDIKIRALFDQIDALYQEMLTDGISKETARMIMPMCCETTLIINGNIRSWMFYLKVRTEESVQWEHREIALLCLDIFRTQLPNIYEAFFVSAQ
jgi:thymidylate synthase (FAD)